MKTQQISTWDKMVHAPFKKVVKFDLICMGIGAIMGMGIGAYLLLAVYSTSNKISFFYFENL